MSRRRRSRDGLWMDDEMSRVPTGLFAFLIALVLIAAAVWGAGYFFFRSHFLPNTTVGGIEASFQTADDIQYRLDSMLEQYDLTVTDRDGNEIYMDQEEIAYGKGSMQQSSQASILLSTQDVFMWPKAFTEDHNLQISVSYDRNAVSEKIGRYTDQHSETRDAYISISGGDYQVVPEVCGVSRQKLMAAVEEALRGQVREMEVPEDCYIYPEVTADDEIIAGTVEKIEQFLSVSIQYEIEGEDISMSRSDVMNTLIVWGDAVWVDEESVERFVQALATRLNTYGDERQFVSAAGDTITIGGGDYGWVVDKAAEKQQILEDLYGAKSVSRPPCWEQTARGPVSSDIGATYVEIDYTAQHLYYYYEGFRLFESDIISGNLNRNSGSPDGVFKIVYKQQDAVLVGEDYRSPVKWFLPFAYNVGFHDASWQSAFGGQLYLSRGSHGCINCPDETAQYLYENLAVGTPVVAYYRTPVTLTNDVARISNAYSYQRPE